jgi:hypothetical protein
MAESRSTMARLDKLERESQQFKRALGQITDILVDQSERIDHVSKRVDELGKTLGGRIDELAIGLGGRLYELGDVLGGRLVRLIAVTIQERTYSVERLADIERRLSKLEERSGS